MNQIRYNNSRRRHQQVLHSEYCGKKSKLKSHNLERGADVLQKLFPAVEDATSRTLFEPNELVKFLRGEKKLRGPFHQFVQATIEWFENGVELKIETDGRMFPVSIRQNIIDCFLKATQKTGITVLGQSVNLQSRSFKEKVWKIETQKIILSKS
jgi:hypothetical protein